jgi:hypothetical protein
VGLALIPLWALPSVGGVIFAWAKDAGTALLLLAPSCCIAYALGARIFLREERTPDGSAESVSMSRWESRLVSRAAGDRTTARPPAASILRATWSSWQTASSVAFGILSPFTLHAGAGLSIGWTVMSVTFLASTARSAWRWLGTTAIDRRRAHRILFLPVVAFAITVGALRFVVPEFVGDRTAFYSPVSSSTWSFRHDTLTLENILEWDEKARDYRDPDAAGLAALVRVHLDAEYGLRVPQERIERTISRGWPASFRVRGSPSAWEAVGLAMARVHSELATELRTNDRIRSLVDAVASVLLALLCVRLGLAGQGRLRKWGGLLPLALVFVAIAPMIAPHSEIARRLFAAEQWVRSVFTDGGMPAIAALLVGACAAGYFLWWSGLQAFRRLDLSDLPPQAVTRWNGGRR